MLTAQRLRELLHYDPETGVFTWLRPTSNRVKVGNRAGCNYRDRGWLIRLDTELHRAARLAWLYMKDEWPPLHLFQENDKVDDLRWANLYQAGRGEKLPPALRASGKPLTAARLRKLLDYDPATGVFTRRTLIGKRARLGAPTGLVNDRGYVLITVDGRRYRAHHLAWLHVYGVWPASRLDHRDLSRANNRIRNLRLATGSQNQANRGKQANNTSGYKGVYWIARENKWLAKIVRHGRQFHIGLFDDPRAAHAAYCKKARDLHGEFARAS